MVHVQPRTTTPGTRAPQEGLRTVHVLQGQQREGLRVVSVNSADLLAHWKHGHRLAVFGDVLLHSSEIAPSTNLNFIFENQKADFSFLNKRNNLF